MKKLFGNIVIIFSFFILFFTMNSYAATLSNINIALDKTNLKPGEDVNINIDFGENLGAYTLYVAYDDNIFEYVTTDGGSANDTGDKVIVVYYDTTGGNSSKNSMNIKFKAKSNITTSNPTEFLITAEGIANSDASILFDDITVPIVKNVTVEPEYKDYELKLEPAGEVLVNSENEMKITFSSTLGKYYEHARLIASVTGPDEAIVNLIGKESSGEEHDIIQSGWGNANGFGIGGENYSQILNIKGKFSKIGDYVITLSLIDRNNSDSIIVQKSFSIKAVDKIQENDSNENNTSKIAEENTTNQITSNTISNTGVTENSVKSSNKKQPTKLPKTGTDIFIPSLIISFVVIGIIIYINKRK